MLKLSEQYKLLLLYMVFSKCKQTQISCLFSYYRTTEFDVNISNSAGLFDAALFEKLAPKRCCCICFTHCLRFQKKIFLRFFMKRSKLNTRIREENSTEHRLQLRFFFSFQSSFSFNQFSSVLLFLLPFTLMAKKCFFVFVLVYSLLWKKLRTSLSREKKNVMIV